MNYQLYFQDEGRAEAEFERDIEVILIRVDHWFNSFPSCLLVHHYLHHTRQFPRRQASLDRDRKRSIHIHCNTTRFVKIVVLQCLDWIDFVRWNACGNACKTWVTSKCHDDRTGFSILCKTICYKQGGYHNLSSLHVSLYVDSFEAGWIGIGT